MKKQILIQRKKGKRKEIENLLKEKSCLSLEVHLLPNEEFLSNQSIDNQKTKLKRKCSRILRDLKESENEKIKRSKR